MVIRSAFRIFLISVTFLSQVRPYVMAAGDARTLSFLTQEENEFLQTAVRENANNATISTGDGGWVHCFFGLDTVVWREGQMQSLCWGQEIKSTTSKAQAISGISRNAYAFLFRGELQVLGGRDFLHWHNHWLTFGPASNWYVRDLNGDVPEVIDGRRVARVSTETLWVFDAEQNVRRLDVEQGAFTLIGEIQPELKNYLGSFQIIELWDYILFFGDLGGGVMKKATQEFVMNHELKLASLVGAEGWSMVANSLHLQLTQRPNPVLIDADAIFNESAPATLVVASAVETLGVGLPFEVGNWGWALALVGGWAGGAWMEMYRRKRKATTSSTSQEMVSAQVESVQKSQPPPPKLVIKPVESPKKSAPAVEVEDVQPLAAQLDESEEQPLAPSTAPKRASVTKGGSVEDIIAALVEGGNRQYTAADLNDQFGIATLSSDESQRARRARLVRQINDIYKRQHNRSLILRDRDPKDRRHLIYRIKP